MRVSCCGRGGDFDEIVVAPAGAGPILRQGPTGPVIDKEKSAEFVQSLHLHAFRDAAEQLLQVTLHCSMGFQLKSSLSAA
jgi:hypothetical protein